jgi:hypothetical protein
VVVSRWWWMCCAVEEGVGGRKLGERKQGSIFF